MPNECHINRKSSKVLVGSPNTEFISHQTESFIVVPRRPNGQRSCAKSSQSLNCEWIPKDDVLSRLTFKVKADAKLLLL